MCPHQFSHLLIFSLGGIRKVGGVQGGGGGKLAGTPLLQGSPYGPRRILSLNPLGTEAKLWLSASNIGRGGGGVPPV